MSVQDDIARIQREQEIIRTRLAELAVAEDPSEGDEIARAEILDDRNAEIDDLTARYDELEVELGPLVERSRRLSAVLDAAREPSRTEAGDGSRSYLGGAPAFNPRKDPFEGDARTLPRQEVISRAMTVLEREKYVPISDDAKAQVEKYIHRSGTREDEGDYQLDGSYIARRMLLTENDAYRSAFQKYARYGATGALSPAEQEAVARFQDFEVRRAMGEVTTTAGGYGVPVERELVAA